MSIFKPTKVIKKSNSRIGMYLNSDMQQGHLIAEIYNDYLVWPGTRIPLIDQTLLKNYKKKDYIERKIEAALDNDKLCDALWKDKDILSLTLRKSS